MLVCNDDSLRLEMGALFHHGVVDHKARQRCPRERPREVAAALTATGGSRLAGSTQRCPAGPGPTLLGVLPLCRRGSQSGEAFSVRHVLCAAVELHQRTDCGLLPVGRCTESQHEVSSLSFCRKVWNTCAPHEPASPTQVTQPSTPKDTERNGPTKHNGWPASTTHAHTGDIMWVIRSAGNVCLWHRLWGSPPTSMADS
jgi:hypothetical protein